MNNELKTLEQRADRAFSRLVVLRGRCEKCGCRYHLETHHLVRRAIHAARWVTGLALCLCDNCHRLDATAAHANPDAFDAWLTERMPETAALRDEYLYRRCCEKVSQQEVEAVCEELEGQLYGVAA